MPKYVINSSLLYHINVLVLIILCAGCATPIAPSGGPRDSTGPVVMESKPATGTTNFTGRKIEFQFDEWVNRTTVNSNITIEPDLGIGYSTDWKRKKLVIEFEDDLPDSTTIIITLGGDISDVNNNKIGSPITLAISTGDDIDGGTIIGKLRSAQTGESMESERVLLYRYPVDFSAKAAYVAQTDTSGSFRFSYLREGDYKAVYVDDRNRNKIWESSEAAQPFNRESITLEDDGADTLDVLYVVKQDTIAPKLQGVGMFSSNRLRLRFNENIELADSVTMEVVDTLGNAFSGAYPLYISPSDPFVLFVQSDSALSENSMYSITLEGIMDAAGNPVPASDIQFPGSSQSDTTSQRIIEGFEQEGLFPTEPLEIIYAAPIADPMIFDSLLVVEGDVPFEDWPDIEGFGNRLYVNPQESWIEGIDYQFLAWDPYTQRRKLFNPDTWDSQEFGEVEVTIEGADSSEVYRVILEAVDFKFRVEEEFTAGTTLPDLPPASYIMTVYNDLNKNGVWDMGSVNPYAAPEPYYKQRRLNIQRGFTSEVIIRF